MPIDFGVRVAGESKLTGKVIVNYLQHLFALYTYKFPWLLPAVALLAAVLLWRLVTPF